MIVKSVVSKSGAVVNIHGDAMAARGSVRECTIRAEQCRVAYEILAAHAKRKEKGEAG